MFGRPEVVAFDVIETLFSLEPLRERLEETGLEPDSLELWFASVLRDGLALSAAGSPRPFTEVAEAALRVLLASQGLQREDDAVEHFLEGFATLPPFPDVRPAFELLREAGIRVVTLTNGSEASTEQLLERAGLRSLVERCLSVESFGLWKPFPEPYLFAAEVCRVEPSQMALVAVHAWDVLGASAAGLTAAWVSRREKLLRVLGPAPVLVGEDLVDVSRRLIAGPPSLEAYGLH
jgi:2-haloacid dehalogenase